ncbi:MAG: type II secretion system protein [Anaerolineae bacterium]|nr:type II secretion system protein [Gloeobacterales cyanobacterium ES-bin-313]
MRNKKAFTAIEIAVVVVLIGALAAIAIPSLRPLLQQRQLGQATQQVEQFLRRAQQTAINRDRTVYVLYTAANGSVPAKQYLVVGDPCRPDTSTDRLSDIPGNDRIDGISIEELPSQVDIDLAATSFDDGNCPDPATTYSTVNTANDMPTTTTNPNTIVFDFQGQVRNSNSGKSVSLRLAGTTGPSGTRDTFVLTQLGDVGTVVNAGTPYYPPY